MREAAERTASYWHRCSSCAHESSFTLLGELCPRCGDTWWDVVYDIEGEGPGTDCLGIAEDDSSMWRYRSLLPRPIGSSIRSLQEG